MPGNTETIFPERADKTLVLRVSGFFVQGRLAYLHSKQESESAEQTGKKEELPRNHEWKSNLSESLNS